MTNWITATIVKNHKWTNTLFSLILTAKIKPFIAGQFTKIAMKINNTIIHRAYSYVNSPNNPNIEFYLVKIDNGKLTPNLYSLKRGDTIYISKYSSGFFTIQELPNCKTLWMLSTGTAIGPFLSILDYGKDLHKFKKIILVHAVRYKEDLNYLNKMKKFEKKYKNKLKIQTITSREISTKSLYGRIPNLIKNGELENSVNEKIDSFNSHVMICGNPNMIKDTQKILQSYRNMRKHLRRSKGHITVEQYW